MYTVSNQYLLARAAPVKEERITGGIKLKDGTLIAVDDSVLVKGTLTINKKACGNTLDIGTATSSVLTMTIKDEHAYDHDFGGALIKLTYGIVTSVSESGVKTWEDVPLPPFFVNGHMTGCVRNRNTIKLEAYDTMTLLDINFGDGVPSDLWQALLYACNRAGVGLAITESEFGVLPNATITADFTDNSIKSCRDIVMWIAQTTNTCAFCDYRGLLMLKQYNYHGDGTFDRSISANERVSIEYSDTRTYLAYLKSYSGDDVKLYSKVTSWTGSDAPHIKEGTMSLPKNPILKKLTADAQDAINQSYFNRRSYPTRYIKSECFVDPALELLDLVAFSGGSIDIGQIISAATQIKWKYRGKGTIICANITENTETASATSAQSNADDMIAAFSDNSDNASDTTSDDVIRLEPQSQLQKQIDGLAGMIGEAGDATRLVYQFTMGGKKVLAGAVTARASGSLVFHDFDSGTDKVIGSFEARDGHCMLTWKDRLGNDRYLLDWEVNDGMYVETLTGAAMHMDDEMMLIQIFPEGRRKTAKFTVNLRGDVCLLSFKPSSQYDRLNLELRTDGLYYNGKKVLTE